MLFLDGGYVSNAGTGTITGAYFGVQIKGTSASVTNFGSISSSAVYTGISGFDAAGVDLAAGGMVTNGPSADIRATWKGVEIGVLTANVGGTVLNQGMIYASNSSGNTGAAVWIHGPGLISNAATGTIAGGPFGIVAYYQTTVVNLGSISGTEFAFDAPVPALPIGSSWMRRGRFSPASSWAATTSVPRSPARWNWHRAPDGNAERARLIIYPVRECYDRRRRNLDVGLRWDRLLGIRSPMRGR